VKISIITVCLNAAATVRDAVESVAAQSYPEIEHIVIDGGSTDGTLDVLKSSNGRISRLVSEKDEGLYDAMNKGARFCTGEVIGFLNADDVYASDYVISKIAHCFEEPSIGACYGDLEYVARSDTSKIQRRWTSGEFRQGSFAQGWAPPHPAFFVRREHFASSGGFDLRFRVAADNDLMMRLLEVERIKCVYIPEVFVKMRSGGASNRSLRNILRGNLEIWRALNEKGLNPRFYSFLAGKAAFKAKHFSDAARNPGS
jgi:glycosyltransferase involved in cell wall biosynthesis